MDNFFAKYARATAQNKEQAAKLLNSDNIIGDCYELKTKIVEGEHKAIALNRFGDSPAFFDEDIAREIDLCKAKGLKTVAYLSLIGFTETNSEAKEAKPSNYWADFLIIGYSPAYKDEFETFLNNVSKALSNGKRPDLSINQEEFDKIVDSKGKWFPTKTISAPKKEKGTVILRSRMTARDKVIEQGRNKNIGCYILSWVFLLAVVTGIIYLIAKLLGIGG